MDTSQSLELGRLHKVSLAFKLKKRRRTSLQYWEGWKKDKGLLASQAATKAGSNKEPDSKALCPAVLTALVLHSGLPDPLTTLYSENPLEIWEGLNNWGSK